MPKLRFLGTFIRYADLRIDKDDQTVVRIHLTSSLTSPLAEKLGCEDVLALDHVTAAPVKLDIGDLLITDARLEVENLGQHALEISGHKLCEFAAIRREQDGAVTRELRYQLTASGAQTPLVSEYLATIGMAPGLLTVSTQEQETLPEAPAETQQELSAG